MKIISGGQTGVDRAALDVALSLGIDCGGWCPTDRLDENGRIPEPYPVRELPDAGFAERTAQNVIDSDGTLIIYSGEMRGGTAETARVAEAQTKPHLLIDAAQTSSESAAQQLREFVTANRIGVLNVAGPRASEWPDGYDFARAVLTAFLCDSSEPEISFIVPAHNEEHELPATLEAIHAAARPSGKQYEVIVVDDASTDRTAEVARQFDARVVAVNRRQIAAVRNAGARAAGGQIFFFVDADTQIAPHHVSLGIEALSRGYSGGSARVVVDRKVPIWAQILLHAFSTFYFAARLGVGAFIFVRRESFEKVGGFDEQYFAGEEYHLSLALKKLGPFKIIDQPIVTSARKIRMYPPRVVLAQSFFIVFGGKRALRKREKLDLWYDGTREPRSSS